MSGGFAKLKRRARRLKRQIWALYLALKDPETPRSTRLLIILAIAYATSPIDLIPDFIPILGQLDDLVILPALIALALRRIPSPVMARCRREAWKRLESGERVKTPVSTIASILVIAVWLGLAAWFVSLLLSCSSSPQSL